MKLIYAGERLNALGDGAFQCFVQEGDQSEEQYYRGIRFVVIGGIYESKKGKMKRTPACLGNIPDREIKQAWRDADRAASEMRKRSREQAKAKRIVDESWAALYPLHERAWKLNFFEREAFAKYVARLIIQGPEKLRSRKAKKAKK